MEPVEHRRLRAPREDGVSLIEPPLDQVSELVGENVRLRDQLDYDFHIALSSRNDLPFGLEYSKP